MLLTPLPASPTFAGYVFTINFTKSRPSIDSRKNVGGTPNDCFPQTGRLVLLNLHILKPDEVAG
jgi:hypothetical protein